MTDKQIASSLEATALARLPADLAEIVLKHKLCPISAWARYNRYGWRVAKQQLEDEVSQNERGSLHSQDHLGNGNDAS